MAEPQATRRAALFLALGIIVLALAVGLRGPVALVALATAAAVVGLLFAGVPLLRGDGIDWDWQPKRMDALTPEPGIGRVRLLLDPGGADSGAPARLQALVRAIAQDRVSARSAVLSQDAPAPDATTALARYLAGPPRRLDLAEVERVITDLETLTPRRTT